VAGVQCPHCDAGVARPLPHTHRDRTELLRALGLRWMMVMHRAMVVGMPVRYEKGDGQTSAMPGLATDKHWYGAKGRNPVCLAANEERRESAAAMRGDHDQVACPCLGSLDDALSWMAVLQVYGGVRDIELLRFLADGPQDAVGCSGHALLVFGDRVAHLRSCKCGPRQRIP